MEIRSLLASLSRVAFLLAQATSGLRGALGEQPAMTDNVSEVFYEVHKRILPYADDKRRPVEEETRILHHALMFFRDKMSLIMAALEDVHADMSLDASLGSLLGNELRMLTPLLGSSNVRQIAVRKTTLLRIVMALRNASISWDDLGLGDDKNNPLQAVRPLVPAQKLAPLQFDIRDGRLVIQKRKSEIDQQDSASAGVAKELLVEGGRKIISELSRTNCDRRIVDIFSQLQDQLQSDDNVIKVGLTNIACTLAIEELREELPGALIALLRSHARGVDMYVAQFPEWSRFLENVAAAEIVEADVKALHDTTEKIVETLKKHSEVVDPEIPATFTWMRELIAKPSEAAKRAAFAIVRSIENLVSRILKYGLDYLDQSAKKSVEALSSATAKVVVITMLSVALGGTAYVLPISSKIRGMEWMKHVPDALQKQIEALKK